MVEATRAIVPAWVYPENQCDPVVVLGRGSLPHYHLKFLSDVGGRDVRFLLLTTNGLAVTPDAWRATGYFPKLDQYRFVLSGDHRPWIVVSAWENALVKGVEVTLRPEERRVVTAVRVKGEPKSTGVVAVVYSDGDVLYVSVDRQHDAYHYPAPGTSAAQRPGWPIFAPEIITRAMDAASP